MKSKLILLRGNQVVEKLQLQHPLKLFRTTNACGFSERHSSGYI